MYNWLKTGRIKGADCTTSNSANKAGGSADEPAINENILAAVMDKDLRSDKQEIKKKPDNSKVSKKRKYDESYLSFGFVRVESVDIKHPGGQCVVCNKILYNSSLVPAKLKKLDESTDVAGLAVLIAIVRYVFEESIEEDLLLCTPLDANATGEEMFKIQPLRIASACSCGQESSIRLLQNVLSEAVKMVNYIKSRPLQSRLIKKVCEERGSQHQSLLIHTEVRWLSSGKFLARLFELHDELHVFLMGEDLSVPGKFTEFYCNKKWLTHCAYLADIFGKHNEVSLSLQKLHNNISEHLMDLIRSLSEYFPDISKDIDCVQNPFASRSKPAMLSVPEYEELIEIQCSSGLKTKFESVPLNEFWVGLKDKHPSVAEKATLVLLPFVSTYQCESGFSSYAYTTNKFRNMLDAGLDLRIQLSNTKPNFKAIKQFHSSC
ncbi:hypothetical protein PR048_014401 [Dryococelus australis]|uniref:HAT C-terminal dimerisation domain-containing protein n=1 Tax=Dryococelus australis TaxID=614101 RepID=A0ABQ9HE95_9NEOP|nr:hypothetical protein PR048_014401 [Dryococelus australis]